VCLVYSHYTLCRKLNVIFNVWFNLCKKVCYFRHLIWWGNYIFNLWFDFLINVLSKVCFYKSHGTFILTELYWYSIFICMYQRTRQILLKILGIHPVFLRRQECPVATPTWHHKRTIHNGIKRQGAVWVCVCLWG
jgi:hypothetical protein